MAYGDMSQVRNFRTWGNLPSDVSGVTLLCFPGGPTEQMWRGHVLSGEEADTCGSTRGEGFNGGVRWDIMEH
jgi:hypothetical protein